MVMVGESHKTHFAQQLPGTSLIMLMAYREFGIISRAFMLEEHGKMLKDIWSHSGLFQNLSERELEFAEGRIYVELIERVCQLIEDFSSLSYALSRDLSDFSCNVLSRTPSVAIRLQELARREPWLTMLRYPNLETVGFSSEDTKFLKQHYEKNIHVLQKFAGILKSFKRLYWRFYTKHKHANPLIYGLKKIEVDGVPIMTIPAIDYRGQAEEIKGVVMNHSMYKHQRRIANTLIRLMKDLLNRAILFIELNGTPILEQVSYYSMSTNDTQKLQTLIGKYNKKMTMTRYPIDVTLSLDIPKEIIRRFGQFYENLDLDVSES